MRDAKSQCGESMVPVRAMQQPTLSHVRNAKSEGARSGHDGQRCALLTMKSRNTCTRATDFSSSG